MTVGASVAVRNAALDAIGAMLDSGTGISYVNIYVGARPAGGPSAAATGLLLATLQLANDATAAASGGSMTFNTIQSDGNADNDGLAGWARIYKAGQTAPGSIGNATDVRLDLTCSSEGGSGDIKFADRQEVGDGNNFVQGGTVTISSFSLTFPEG